MNHIDKHTYGPWAIITGASSGIGEEFARQLAASGLNLVLVARRKPLLDALGQKLMADYSISYRVIAADLSEPDAFRTIAAETESLDIGLLVSNAGTGNPSEFLNAAIADLIGIVRLNIGSHLDLVYHFGPKLVRRGRGGIVLVSALGAAQGLPFMSNDGATKAYVLSMGEALHVELGEHGVHVTTMLPGGVETPVIAKLGLDPATMPIHPIPVEQGVRETIDALVRNHPTIIPGALFRMMAALTPSAMMTRMNGRMLGRAAAAKHATAG